MTQHRYPKVALLADYARAALGLALTVPPLLLVARTPVAVAILGGLAVLFACFALATLLRQLGTVRLDDRGIAVAGGWSRRIAWQSLDRLRLRWFAARRDRQKGYMELALKGGGRRIAIDSRIEGFDALVAAAFAAAEARRLALDDTTLANLAALGFVPEASRQSSVVSGQFSVGNATNN
jgi:hypothetical protein